MILQAFATNLKVRMDTITIFPWNTEYKTNDVTDDNIQNTYYKLLMAVAESIINIINHKQNISVNDIIASTLIKTLLLTAQNNDEFIASCII